MKRTVPVLAGALAFLVAAPCLAQSSQAPSDAQIAAIVVTANQVDIDAGTLAKSKGSSRAIKEFAQRMITDHTGVNKEAKELVTRLKVTPQPSDTSKSLQQGGDENLAALKALSGEKFDRAYVQHEIAYHEQVIDALDNALIPNAKNAELKSLLVKVRPAFVSHLEHAKHIEASLGKQG